MTIRRKNPDGDGEETLKISSLGLGTNSFRVALLVLVLSMHPVGRQLLGTFGFKFPDEQKVAAAVEQTNAANKQLDGIAKDVTGLTSDMTKMKEDLILVKASVSQVQSKQDRLELSLTGFQVDFDKFRKTPTK